MIRDELILTYTINDTNNSLINTTENATIPSVYALGPTLATISSTCIIVGTCFSIICIYRYLRKPHLRTYFTYIFHYMLIYCLISSFINVPIFLTGYYLNLFEQSRHLCQYYATNALAINIGMVTCLAYASLERNYLIFRRNGLLSWRRQFLPILCLIFYSYIISILIIFIPQCDYIPCAPCHTRQLISMLIWLTFSLIIPELIMFSSTIILMIRLYRKHNGLNRHRDKNIFHRIVIQMILYMIWSCLYYCPPTFYNLSLIIDSNISSPSIKSAMIIVSIVSVQSYPILTFILMINYHRKTKNTIKKQLQHESKLKLHVLSTITEPPALQSSQIH
ncbi:unnamed protein product [Adineta steineri]|uniref:G-protein coupled receptors family 1 profile domain-containing protein n=1 Tax=Adineta steineri TaxID=433720 RepID=A0A819ECZ5_9BILA|nr:unnamed protein product [Adineta steineri]